MASTGIMDCVMDETTQGLRRLMQVEVEQLLGFPPNHTDLTVEACYNNYSAKIL